MSFGILYLPGHSVVLISKGKIGFELPGCPRFCFYLFVFLLSDHNRASLGTSSKFIGRLQFQAHQPGQLLLPRGKRGGNRETSNGIPKTCLWFGLLSWSGFGATSIWSHWLEWFLHFQYVGFAYQFEPTTRYSIQSKYRVQHNLWSKILCKGWTIICATLCIHSHSDLFQATMHFAYVFSLPVFWSSNLFYSYFELVSHLRLIFRQKNETHTWVRLWYELWLEQRDLVKNMCESKSIWEQHVRCFFAA